MGFRHTKGILDKTLKESTEIKVQDTQAKQDLVDEIEIEVDLSQLTNEEYAARKLQDALKAPQKTESKKRKKQGSRKKRATTTKKKKTVSAKKTRGKKKKEE